MCRLKTGIDSEDHGDPYTAALWIHKSDTAHVVMCEVGDGRQNVSVSARHPAWFTVRYHGIPFDELAFDAAVQHGAAIPSPKARQNTIHQYFLCDSIPIKIRLSPRICSPQS